MLEGSEFLCSFFNGGDIASLQQTEIFRINGHTYLHDIFHKNALTKQIMFSVMST